MSVRHDKPDPTAHEAPELRTARRVLRIEAEALSALAAGLDDAFIAAVDILDRVDGRVVVSGMGKSGHIARKIASTLASTGTPAVFIHPAEASHGDLGMLTEHDAVIVISKSGQTPELTDIVAYTRRFGIPLIAIVGRTDSTLAETTDVVLALPSTPEACPMGLAPTTSTTATLALGDALAVALLERKGFSSDQFQVLHPGGQLGKLLIKVSDIMHEGDGVPLVAPDTTMGDAVITMTSKSFGCVGVVDSSRGLLGIITDGDLRRHMAPDRLERPDLLSQTVADVMTPEPKTIRPQALAAEALGSMNASAITSLFVVDGGAVVGIVHMHDCLRAGVV